jgi:hypothetical protein
MLVARTVALDHIANLTVCGAAGAGAGKTFTMSGGKQSYKQRGVIPRALGQVFAEVKAMPDRESKISIQYLEVRASRLVTAFSPWASGRVARRVP